MPMLLFNRRWVCNFFLVGAVVVMSANTQAGGSDGQSGGNSAEVSGVKAAREFGLENRVGWVLEFHPNNGTVLFRNPLLAPDREMILFDYADGREVKRFKKTTSLGHNTLSPNGLWLAGIGGTSRLYFLNTRDGTTFRAPKKHDDEIMGLNWLPDSKRLISWSKDRRVCLWGLGPEQSKPSLLAVHEHWVFLTVVPSPDGTRAAAAGTGGEIELLDTRDRPMVVIRRLPRIVDPHYHKIGENNFKDAITGREYAPPPGHQEHGMCFTALAYFPDSRRLATGSSDCTVLVLDTETGEELARHHDKAGGRTSIKEMAVSPDGKYVLFTAATGPIHLWDWQAGRIAASYEGHPRVEKGVKTQGVTSALAFTPDGRHALSGGEGGTVRMWKVPE